VPNSRISALLAALAATTLLAAGCGGEDGDSSSAASGLAASGGAPAKELRLGFFANVTHAAPLVGLKEGIYAKELGSTELKTQTFNAGPAAVEAIFAGTLDATYIGPNPAINAFFKSDGEAIRIVAGAASGGAALVVKPEINGPADLKGKTVATPQLGNTQDVALRAWLKENGMTTSPSGGGDVSIAPMENATTLQLFQDGEIDGAWLPEPWASRLVLDAGAKVLVDEKDLWPEGKFVTTHLIVTKKFLDEHPQTVEALLRGHVETVEWINANSGQAKADVNAQLEEFAGKALEQPVIDRAWSNIQITADPVASSLKKSADNANAAGLLKEATGDDLAGIYSLGPVNTILKSRGLAEVTDAGLGQS
jgi:NitT/TauT family transport system substrate-binding protein